MSLHYHCGNGRLKTCLAKSDLGLEVLLCCPGPSLGKIDKDLRGPGRLVVAINTAYPKVVPDLWIGLDTVACYSPKLWQEPFMKILRYPFWDDPIEGMPVHKKPNTWFITLKEQPPENMFGLRQADTTFVWNSSGMMTALHVLVWMGARKIRLVGCDFGGERDYWDERKLPDDLHKRNRQLYRSQVETLAKLHPLATKCGISLISSTPDSPVNRFLPFEALSDPPPRETPVKLDVPHVMEISPYRWRSSVSSDRMAVLRFEFGDGSRSQLRDRLEKFRWTNRQLPLGLLAEGKPTESDLEFCQQQGFLLEGGSVPQALLKSPAATTVVVPDKADVTGDLKPVFELPDGSYDGVLVYRRGSKMIEQWAKETHFPIKFSREVPPELQQRFITSVVRRSCESHPGHLDNHGVMTGADSGLEWALPWWYAKYREAGNGWPVAFADFGMSHKMRDWCEARGPVVPVPEVPWGPNGSLLASGAPTGPMGLPWYAKPAAMLGTPFAVTVWLDVDCEVRKPLRSWFMAAQEGILTVTEDPCTPFVKRKPAIATGVVGYRRGDLLLAEWHTHILQRREKVRSDQEAFNEVLEAKPELLFKTLPIENQWLRLLGDTNPATIVMHWTGREGKEIIRKAAAELQKCPSVY